MRKTTATTLPRPADYYGLLSELRELNPSGFALEVISDLEMTCYNKYLDFDWIVSQIKSGLMGHVKAGIYLQFVRYSKAYRNRFKTFRTFCEKVLNRTQSYCIRIIDASLVTLKLMSYGFEVLPQNESQARNLVGLSDDKLCDKWREVIDAANGHPITAQHINKVLNPEVVALKKVAIPADLWEKLEGKAAVLGITPQELLEQLIDGVNPNSDPDPEEESGTTPVQPEKFANWQQDLEILIAEQDGKPIVKLDQSG